VHVRWEHADLAAQAGLLGFSLCLRPVVHKKPQDMRWQHRSLAGREVEFGAIGHAVLRSPPLDGGRI
jgi:hypothetical protein